MSVVGLRVFWFDVGWCVIIANLVRIRILEVEMNIILSADKELIKKKLMNSVVWQTQCPVAPTVDSNFPEVRFMIGWCHCLI